MSKIVQFTHPGAEHKHDKLKVNHKSWNTGKHKRKFLCAKGSYVEHETLKDGDLMFWGEWEPPSIVIKMEKQNELMPSWLHKPYLPRKLPVSDGYQKSYQNTDPFVFGKCFMYFVCKQFRLGTNSATQFASLDKGSIILFGSTKGKDKNSAFFQLDTVFVVSDFIEYDPSNSDALSQKEVPKIYRDIVFKMAFPNPIQPLKNNVKLRLYQGATFMNKYKDMYSFSPAKIYNKNKSGFPRVKLKDLKYITNNLNAAPKISEVDTKEITTFWENIRNMSRNQGCVEGVRFEYPKKHT